MSSYSYRGVFKGTVTDEETVARAHAFDDYLSNGSYEGVVYRGGVIPDGEIDLYKVGATINQKKGPSSWSKSKSVAEGFAQSSKEDFGGKKIVYVMPGGTRTGMDISDKSRFKWEQEVAISSKSQQVIKRKSIKNGIMYLTVKEV